MKKIILTSALLTLVSCGTFKEDCGRKDWNQLGQKAFNSDLEASFSRESANCENPPVASMKEEFIKGANAAKMISCSGLEKINEMTWEQIGNEAALMGQTENFYQELSERCHYPAANNEQIKKYKLGYKSALQVLCTKLGGADFARKGLQYRSTCPKDAEKEFTLGRSVGMKMKEVDDINASISKLNAEIEDIHKEIDKEKEVSHECQANIEDIRRGKKPYAYNCYGNNEEDFITKLRASSTKIANLESTSAGKKRKVEALNSSINAKYKEIEILNSMLKQ